jgi:hypothetical protein
VRAAKAEGAFWDQGRGPSQRSRQPISIDPLLRAAC